MEVVVVVVVVSPSVAVGRNSPSSSAAAEAADPEEGLLARRREVSSGGNIAGGKTRHSAVHLFVGTSAHLPYVFSGEHLEQLLLSAGFCLDPWQRIANLVQIKRTMIFKKTC